MRQNKLLFGNRIVIHTLGAAIDHAFDNYGEIIGAYDTITSYSGVRATIIKPIVLKNTNCADRPECFGEVNVTGRGNVNLIQTPKPIKDEPGYGKNQELYYRNLGGDAPLTSPVNLGIRFQPGVIKLRVYIWIEGQDYDCEDYAPGTDLQFNLSFTGALQ